jgi:DNA-3-methyladenine glycosylase I
MHTTKKHDLKKRCSWAGENTLLIQYHDTEWGVPVHDESKHFEYLTLEGAQAGLSWLTILKKRSHYRKLFRSFDPEKVASMTDEGLTRTLTDTGIVRNKRKVFSVRNNAYVFLTIQKHYGSFDEYIWGFVNHKQIVNRLKDAAQHPTQTAISQAVSLDLKRRGMTFVGSKVIYAYMQAAGLVNGHAANCWRHRACCV